MKKIEIQSDRLWERLNIMGTFGADPQGGVSRFAWEKPYKDGIQQLLRWGEEAGLESRVDTVGNVFLRLNGTEKDAPAVLSGSHFDTVPQGGYFDGMAGVMGALEAIISIKESGRTFRKSLEMVGFVNEEASQFLGGTFGSKAMCGMISADYAYKLKHRTRNQTLAEAMREYGMGLNPDRICDSVIKAENYTAFIEMHIEQGRCLLDRGLPVAVVTDIAGIKQFYITLIGVAAHAGGMAMKDRHDTVAAAARIVTKVESLVKELGTDARGTVGLIEAFPGEHNIIAEKCTISVDFREADDKKWESLYKNLIEFVEQECEIRGLTYQVCTTCNNNPAHCDRKIQKLFSESARMRNIPCGEMVSYPAHDAMNMERILPMGMLFLRSSNGGVSHCPNEYTKKSDLERGTEMLADVLYSLAE